MSLTIEQIEKLLDEKLSPINKRLNEIDKKLANVSKDLTEMRDQFGYGNLSGALKVIKNSKDHREEM